MSPGECHELGARRWYIFLYFGLMQQNLSQSEALAGHLDCPDTPEPQTERSSRTALKFNCKHKQKLSAWDLHGGKYYICNLINAITEEGETSSMRYGDISPSLGDNRVSDTL